MDAQLKPEFLQEHTPYRLNATASVSMLILSVRTRGSMTWRGSTSLDIILCVSTVVAAETDQEAGLNTWNLQITA